MHYNGLCLHCGINPPLRPDKLQVCILCMIARQNNVPNVLSLKDMAILLKNYPPKEIKKK